MVAGIQSRFPALAADRASADADWLTSALKTRVGVFRRRPSGRCNWPGTIRSDSRPNTLTTNPICFATATAITSRHCAGKFQSRIHTRPDMEMQSARIRFNQPRETRFKHHENCKINHRCSVCAADGTNRFCLLLPVNGALAVA